MKAYPLFMLSSAPRLLAATETCATSPTTNNPDKDRGNGLHSLILFVPADAVSVLETSSIERSIEGCCGSP